MLSRDVLRLNEVARDGRAWKQLRESLFSKVTDEVRAAAHSQSAVEQQTQLAETRKLHNVVYVADRIRRHAIERRSNLPKDLVSTAAALLERRAAGTRTAVEQGFVTTARVHWHLLLKRAGLGSGHRSGIARQLRGLSGGPFSVEDVPSLLLRHMEDTLRDLRILVRDACEAFPAAASETSVLSDILDRILGELESMAKPKA